MQLLFSPFSLFQPTLAGAGAQSRTARRVQDTAPLGRERGNRASGFCRLQKSKRPSCKLCSCSSVPATTVRTTGPYSTPLTDPGQRLLFLFPSHPPLVEFWVQQQLQSAERAERGRVLPGGWQAQLARWQLLFLPFSFFRPAVAGAGARSRTARS